MFAVLVELERHRIVLRERLLPLILDLVGHLAGFDHIVGQLLDLSLIHIFSHTTIFYSFQTKKFSFAGETESNPL